MVSWVSSRSTSGERKMLARSRTKIVCRRKSLSREYRRALSSVVFLSDPKISSRKYLAERPNSKILTRIQLSNHRDVTAALEDGRHFPMG
jgi:hypothetical protein